MTNAVIVDTSLAVKWLYPEDLTTEARRLLGDWRAHNVLLHVPSWFACEVTNVIFQRVRQGASDLVAAQAALRDVLSLVTARDFEPAVSVRAIEIALQLGQKASYDAQYLALAEHLDCELWTADQRFWQASRIAFPQVRWVGEIGNGAV